MLLRSYELVRDAVRREVAVLEQADQHADACGDERGEIDVEVAVPSDSGQRDALLAGGEGETDGSGDLGVEPVDADRVRDGGVDRVG